MGRGQPPPQIQQLQQPPPQPQQQGLPFGGAGGGPQPGSGNALLQLLQGRGAIGASGLPSALSQPTQVHASVQASASTVTITCQTFSDKARASILAPWHGLVGSRCKYVKNAQLKYSVTTCFTC